MKGMNTIDSVKGGEGGLELGEVEVRWNSLK
jgi:hypothetical protein